MISALLAFALASPALAGAGGKGDAEKDPFWQRIHLWVGGDAGYTFIDPTAAGELNKHGYQLEPKGSVSFSWTDFTAEATGGWFYNWSKGSTSGGPVLKDRLITKAAFADLSGRYRLSRWLEVGLTSRFLMGADTRFQTTLPQSDHLNWLVGPMVAYRFPFQYPVELTGTFLTDATISGRQTYQFLVGAQIGIPVWNFVPKAAPAPVAVATPAPTPIPSPTPVPTPVAQPKAAEAVNQTFVFVVERVEFDFNSDRLRPDSAQMLRNLGSALAEHPEAWEKLTVEGHTDHKGSYAYNLKLSQRRAESVREVFLQQGLKSVEAVGYSFSKPRVPETNPESRQKNRRVELKFEGVKQADTLEGYFKTFQK